MGRAEGQTGRLAAQHRAGPAGPDQRADTDGGSRAEARGAQMSGVQSCNPAPRCARARAARCPPAIPRNRTNLISPKAQNSAKGAPCAYPVHTLGFEDSLLELMIHNKKEKNFIPVFPILLLAGRTRFSLPFQAVGAVGGPVVPCHDLWRTRPHVIGRRSCRPQGACPPPRRQQLCELGPFLRGPRFRPLAAPVGLVVRGFWRALWRARCRWPAEHFLPVPGPKHTPRVLDAPRETETTIH